MSKPAAISILSGVPQPLDSDEVDEFLSSHGIPDYITPTGQNVGIDPFLKLLADPGNLASLRYHLTNETFHPSYLSIFIAHTLIKDDGPAVLHNCLLLAEYFHRAGIEHHLNDEHFTSAVGGLRVNQSQGGKDPMRRMTTSAELLGAAAVVRFIGTMDTDGLVKLSQTRNVAVEEGYSLAITNRWLDQLLRKNPEKFDAVCAYLQERRVTKTKKSIAPLLDHLGEDSPVALSNGWL